MPKSIDTQHSILIVSSSGQFDAIVSRSLTGYISKDICKSAAIARRFVIERYYDLVVINAPLPDENGEDLAMDVSENCNASILLVTPQDVADAAMERLSDHGILIVPKPAPGGRIDKAIRFLFSIQDRIHAIERKRQAAEEKIEELRIVSKAKILLVEKKKMTEDEAHRYIGKQAMDRGVSRRRIAERILDDL
ncbi:MAG: ANTAR domain-containing protein [Lachnospiraceae bacterium]|nr:ANTAR domain-containing protein [Lachnospiraceae bacterium]